MTTYSITVAAHELREALTKVKPAACYRRGATPELSQVRFQTVAPTKVALSAFDAETYCEFSVKVQGDANTLPEGAIVSADFKQLWATVSKRTAADAKRNGVTECVLEFTPGNVTIRVGMVTHTVSTVDWANLPMEPETGDGFGFDVAPSVFATMGRFQGDNSVRPILTAVCVQREVDGGVIVVATDSYRLGSLTVKGQTLPKASGRNPGGPDGDMLIPLSVTKILGKLRDADGVVKITWSPEERFMLAECPGEYFVAGQMVSGQFPNWQRLVPNWEQDEVHVNVAQTAQFCADAAGKDFEGMPVKISTMDGEGAKVHFSASVQDGPSMEADLQGGWTWVDGKAPANGFTVGLNPKFLKDIADECPNDTLGLSFTDNSKPVKFSWDHTSGGEFVGIVMPVRVN